jgi:hypothetical protein
MRVVSRTETPALVAEDTQSTTLRLDARPRTEAPERPATAPARESLERELDRVQSAVQAGEATFGQQITWLLLAQALFLNAYLMVLVFGAGAAIPGKRWLLAGLAIFATAFAVFTYLALRGSRDSLRSLRATRRDVEAALAKLGREPVFAPRNFVTAGLSSFASSLLPATFVAGWLAISVYALAAPNGPRPIEEQVAAPIDTPAPPAARPAPPRAFIPRGTTPSMPALPPDAAPIEPAPAGAQPADEPKKRTGFKW